jgi:sterol desaturase/sphingolipid hydroxylase (fatty acid hydroxylase superfamily)
MTAPPDCFSNETGNNVIRSKSWEMAMSLGTILLIVLVLLLLGALPAWPYSTGWGYYPSGGLGLLLVVLLVLVFTGRV